MGLHFVNITVGRDTISTDLLRVLAELRPEWPTDQIKTEELNGGFVNAMYKCWIEPNDQDNSKLVKPIILRVFSFKFNKEKMEKDYNKMVNEFNASSEQETDQINNLSLNTESVLNDTAEKGMKNELVKSNNFSSSTDKTEMTSESDFDKMFFDRINESEVMHQLSQIAGGLCSRVYGRFVNGFAYDFVEGNTLTHPVIIKEEFIKNFTYRLALFHSADIQIPSARTFETMEDKLKATFEPFLIIASKEIQEHIQKSSLVAYQKYPKMDFLNEEIKNLQTKLQELGLGTIGFCHNDLNPKNGIYNAETKKFWFIDFELAMPNYICYDIATHFVAHCGHFLDEFEVDRIPASQFRLNWIRRYLTEWQKANNRQVEPDQMEQDMWNLHRRVSLMMGILLLRFTIMGPFFQFKNLFSNEVLERNLKERPEFVAKFGLSSYQAYETMKKEIWSLARQDKPLTVAAA